MVHIRMHFQSEVIAENGTDLTEEEGSELGEVFDSLIALQDTDPYTEEKARELAALAFVAGRSFQKEQDHDNVHMALERPAEYVNFTLTPGAAERLVQYLLEPGE